MVYYWLYCLMTFKPLQAWGNELQLCQDLAGHIHKTNLTLNKEHCRLVYTIYISNVTWQEARDDCEQFGQSLLTVCI